MATRTDKFITLSKLAKRDKEHIGTGGDGGLLTDKVTRRRSAKSRTLQAPTAEVVSAGEKQIQTDDEES